MLAERVSLTELGLLPETSGQWPLATWLDHTHAKPAHDALKGLIAAPLSDLAELSARQALLSQLPSISRDIPWTELVALAAQAGRFLSSNSELIPIPRIERALFAARYGDIVTAVAEQLRAVDALISASRQVYGRLARLPGDARFLEVVAAFARVVDDPRSGELREAVAGGHTLTIVSLDTMVRGKRVTPERHGDNPVPFREPLQRLVDAVWQLDAFCSLAIASHRVNGVIPILVPRGAGALELHGLYHPLLPGGVANDVPLATTDRVLFLTGPNMAGKSTLLRSVGIAVYCAHLGMAVPAKAARVPWHDRLMLSITARDNLRRGESLYHHCIAHGDTVRAVRPLWLRHLSPTCGSPRGADCCAAERGHADRRQDQGRAIVRCVRSDGPHHHCTGHANEYAPRQPLLRSGNRTVGA